MKILINITLTLSSILLACKLAKKMKHCKHMAGCGAESMHGQVHQEHQS